MAIRNPDSFTLVALLCSRFLETAFSQNVKKEKGESVLQDFLLTFHWPKLSHLVILDYTGC